MGFQDGLRLTTPASPRAFVKRSLLELAPSRLVLTSGRGDGICLTFDDGPHPEYTPRLLDVLDAAGLRVTFFVVGARAERHPRLVERIARAGHEVGNHSWSHPQPRTLAIADMIGELRRTAELIRSLTGAVTSLYRPPFGRLALRELLRLLAERQTIVLWSCNPKDYQMTAADHMARWAGGFAAQGGDVVLMHDNHPFAVTAVEHLRQRHDLPAHRFRTVSELLDAPSRRSPFLSGGAR